MRFLSCDKRRSRAMAAGVSWTTAIASAPWAGRRGHTSVIDAAGAIYVIGGTSSDNSTIFFSDMQKSIDGGADRRSIQGTTLDEAV